METTPNERRYVEKLAGTLLVLGSMTIEGHAHDGPEPERESMIFRAFLEEVEAAVAGWRKSFTTGDGVYACEMIVPGPEIVEYLEDAAVRLAEPVLTAL
jgi:hypothetical protein